MRYFGFCSLLIIFFFSISFAQVTDSDRRFKVATDYVKEKRKCIDKGIEGTLRKPITSLSNTNGFQVIYLLSNPNIAYGWVNSGQANDLGLAQKFLTLLARFHLQVLSYRKYLLE